MFTKTIKSVVSEKEIYKSLIYIYESRGKV